MIFKKNDERETEQAASLRTVDANVTFPPYIRSKCFLNRPRAARRAPTREIIIIMTRCEGADVTLHFFKETLKDIYPIEEEIL